MASGDYYLQKNNGTTIDEKIFTAVSGKAIGFDASLNPVMLDVSLIGHTHSDFVPYTGAIASVDLGSNSLTTAIVIGGTRSTSTLTLQSSSNIVYVATAPAINFNVGGNGGINAMTIFAGGNVAIGSAIAPTNAKLYLAGGSFLMDNNQTFLTKDTTTGTVSPFHFNNANEMIFGYRVSGTGSYPLKFYTGSSQKMILDANGNLGIGVSSMTAKLEVAGSVFIGSPTYNDATGNKLIVGGNITLQNMAGTDSIMAIQFKGGNQYSSGAIMMGVQITGAAARYFRFYNASSVPIISIANTQYTNSIMGVGVDVPTAYLHIKAGTATAGTAPIKLTAGVNNNTVEPGTFEYNGTDLFFSPGTTRKTIAFTDQLPSSTSITNWNYAATALTAGVKSNNCLMKWIDNGNCLTAAQFVENDDSSIAIGTFATADGTGSLAVGGNSTALNGSIAFCGNSYADGTGSVAIGGDSVAIGTGALALGGYANAEGNNSIAIGLAAQVYGGSSLAIGVNCIVRDVLSLAFGCASETWGTRDIAFGHYAKVDTTVAGMGSTMIAVGMNYNGPTLTQGNTLAILGEYNATPIPFFVAINKVTATRTLDVNGNIGCDTLLVDVATGSAPIVVNSLTTCTNLNADLLDGNHASAFAAASHTHLYDNYVSWDVSANGGAASQIYKSGSASSYKGVNFVGSGTVSVSTNSNANGFINVNISGSGSTYTHPAYTAFNPSLSGALILASLTTDAIGAVTAVTTRTLTLANLGYTGATNATCFTGHTIYLNGASLVTIGSGGYLNVVATNAAGDPVVSLTGNAGAYRYDISVSGIPNCTLTGYTAGSTGLVAATDTLKVAFSKLQYQMPKTVYTNVADVLLVGSTPNDFYSYTLPANTLSSDNQRLELVYSGSNAANTNGKSIQFYFGGISYITITNSSATSLNWYLNIIIVRASSSTLRVSFNGNWYTFGSGNPWGSSINFATTNVIKLVTQGGASSDIIGKLCTITHFSS